MRLIEYRVRPVTRYIVTRFESYEEGAVNTSSTVGEYDNKDIADTVGYVVCKAEHQGLGWPPGDERIKYPGPDLPSTQV